MNLDKFLLLLGWRFGASIDEIKEGGAGIEFGKKKGGVGLGVGGFDPLNVGSTLAFVVAPFAKHPASIVAHSHSLQTSM